MTEQRRPIKIDDIKQFLTTGRIEDNVDLGDITLAEAASAAMRYMATQEPLAGTPDAAHLRATAREMHRSKATTALENLTSVDLQTLNYIITSEALDTSLIIRYLRDRGVSNLPILSDTPAEIVTLLREANFTLQVIPTDQFGLTDFSNIQSHPPIPDWYREAQENAKAQHDNETVSLLNGLRERWFLLFTVLLGVTAAVGFSLNLGIEIPDVINQYDLFLSFYGIVAVSRAGIQIRRAERWNRTVRHEMRDEYSDAFATLLDQKYQAADGTTTALTPEQVEEIETLKAKAYTTTGRSIPWDRFKKQFGFEDRPTKEGKRKKPSVLDEYVSATGETLSRDEFIDALASEVIRRNFPEGAPTVAVVIPTYQTTREEMRRLLYSVKDQAYPVDNVYVVYNDDPNDLQKGTKKQIEFLELQQLVDEANVAENRQGNTCQIHIMAQGARGKREAMAMGMAMGLGRTYFDDLKNKHGEALRELHPDWDETELDNRVATSIANLDLRELPDFRHDVVLNIDSDTEILDPLSVLNSAVLMNKHPDAACTTGDVRVVNRGTNLLSEMTYQRYWRAFFVERAAQAPQVTCMSGPWVFMRSNNLAGILDEWYFQEFLGQRCTYGDDRDLSTLFLREGYESLFCPDSVVLTDCPTDWKTFLKQQLRWNKSFNRENFILFPFIHKLSKYVQFDVAYQQTFPFAMLYILSNIGLRGLGIAHEQGPVAGAQSMMPYIVSILLYNELFFGLYGALKNHDAKYFLSPVYIDYHFGALLWLKLKAFFEMKDTAWGTKGEELTVGEALSDFEEEKDRIILELLGSVVTEIEKNPPEDKYLDQTDTATDEKN